MKNKQLLQASVSIFLALILPSSVFVLLAGLRYADERKRETDAVRAMGAARELLLAQYSRELWRDYGLWGYSGEDTDMSPALKVYGRKEGEISYEVTNDLFEEERLRDQILRFMRLRAPAFTGAEMLERIRSAAIEREMIAGQSSLAAVRSAHEQSDAYGAYRQGKEAVNEYTKDQANDESEEVWTDLGDGLRDEVEGSLRSFSRHILPVYEAGGTQNVSEDEVFSPSCVEELAAVMDKLLDQGLGADPDRLCLAQYTLSYFPSEVHLERVGGGLRLLRTPNGDSFQELKEKRPAEAEQIASGHSAVGRAKRHCRNMITLMRFVPRYIASYRDPELQKKYQFWSEILAVAITVVSLGHATVAPAECQYFIRLAHSLYLAIQDTKKMLNGYSLAFWPVKSKNYTRSGIQFELYYRDYLFLLLLARSPDALIGDLERVIRNNNPGDWHTAFQVRFSDREINIEKEAEYLHE